MILNNVYRVGSNDAGNISISKGLIPMAPFISLMIQLVFDNAVVFPGLINSHDHLDFNLFPQLGHHIYHNYTEWGDHIHRNYKTEIDAVYWKSLLLYALNGAFIKTCFAGLPRL
jgi:hypothetical protein